LSRKPFAIFTVVSSQDMDKGAESRMVVMQYTAHVRSMVHPMSEVFSVVKLKSGSTASW
jgi:hypothetical protein